MVRDARVPDNFRKDADAGEKLGVVVHTMRRMVLNPG